MNIELRTQKPLLRECISKNDEELVIFGADNFSQFPHRDNSIRSSCDRALPGASATDLVVLRGDQNRGYFDWLRSLGLGPDNVIAYNQQSSEFSLAQCIVRDPEPILKYIEKTGRKPIYVPWFSGQMEAEAAKVIGADLFGADEAATFKYNDKADFKNICKELGIPVVAGTTFEIAPKNIENGGDMGRVILRLLAEHEEVIIRGTLGESGMSLYRTGGDHTLDVYDEIVASGEKKVIIEPFLDVVSTPNDQWVIGTNRSTHHLGVADQICENGMVHIGTQSCQRPSNRVSDYISETSQTIVDHMSISGYKGVLGIDYVVTDEGIFPVENNARFNGSTYVRLILDQLEKNHFFAACWKFLKIKIKPCSISELLERLGPLLYDGNKLNSVFPYNCNAFESNGFFAIILLSEDYNHLVHLEQSLRKMGIQRA
ncbi:MAG: hypothetical protein ACN4GW_15015 [Desulforhopalus sp.]